MSDDGVVARWIYIGLIITLHNESDKLIILVGLGYFPGYSKEP
jgi:hypothetical protein